MNSEVESCGLGVSEMGSGSEDCVCVWTPVL